jgi:hypothetical protein
MLKRDFRNHVNSFDTTCDDFKQRTRQKQVLLNVIFGQLSDGIKADGIRTDVIGCVYWFLSGLLEASLKYSETKEATIAQLQ